MWCDAFDENRIPMFEIFDADVLFTLISVVTQWDPIDKCLYFMATSPFTSTKLEAFGLRCQVKIKRGNSYWVNSKANGIFVSFGDDLSTARLTYTLHTAPRLEYLFDLIAIDSDTDTYFYQHLKAPGAY